MKTPTLLALSFGLLLAHSQADVVRPAPDFSLQVGDTLRSLKSFRGQPVVLLMADSPSTSAFKRQVEEIESMYDRFASSKVLFVAAFQKEAPASVKSNIPFLISPNGAATCQAFGTQSKFAIAIIGADGNLDYKTEQELHANRIREVLQNSYTVQKSLRDR